MESTCTLQKMDENEQPLDEYNEALDHMVPEEEPEEEDTGGPALETAEALGITEPPNAKVQVLLDQHPEICPDYEEIVLEKLVLRDANHMTYPYLTLYERTKVLSLRASQLARGAPPFIDVPEYLTDVYEVARAELEAKRLPYILKRPLPNGEYEYWRLADLMIL
jgi:DNA-directed RNA polymerase I, II, and III subunit RPABC2